MAVHVSILKDPLMLEALIAKLTTPESGAVSIFSGITRNNFAGKEVTKLEYESHESLALCKMRAICDQAIKDYGVNTIGIEHRIGEVPVGEASVNIVACSSHRKQAIDATSWAIDELKKTVPIWKKEFYSDGTEESMPAWKINPEFEAVLSKKVDY